MCLAEDQPPLLGTIVDLAINGHGDLKEMCSILYQLWSPTERNAFASEDIHFVKNNEIDKAFERTDAYEKIMNARSFVYNRLPYVSDEVLRTILDDCMAKDGPMKHWASSTESFRNYFKKTTIKLCNWLEKKIKGMMNVGNIVESRKCHGMGKGLIGFPSIPHPRFIKSN